MRTVHACHLMSAPKGGIRVHRRPAATRAPRFLAIRQPLRARLPIQTWVPERAVELNRHTTPSAPAHHFMTRKLPRDWVWCELPKTSRSRYLRVVSRPQALNSWPPSRGMAIVSVPLAPDVSSVIVTMSPSSNPGHAAVPRHPGGVDWPQARMVCT